MAEPIKFEETISYRLARLTTAFKNALERHMGPIGLHGGQVFILLELWNQDGLRQVDIGSRLNLAAPTITKMLKGLLEIGLITIEKFDDDGRSKRIFLTDTGREIRSQVESQWLELEASTLVQIGEPERPMLYDLLTRLKSTYTGDSPEDEDDQ
jgi:MarR family transcriptional regulator, organic hydroperoxide resistance regulator